ncbi:MAG: tetratricopeptide repeat protein [Ferruginibacter sp.]
MNPNDDISPEEFELIERYISKEMTPEEEASFSQRLANDTAIQSKLESVRLLSTGVQEAALTEKLNDFHKNISLSKQNLSKKSAGIIYIKRWLVAASVLLLVGVGALLFFNQMNREQKIFTAFYKPDPGMITVMGTSDNYLFDHAMIDYKTKKYDSAIDAWTKLLITNPDNDTLNYFIGSAYLARGETTKAINHFQKTIEKTDSYFLKEAYWYIGLALLKEKKIDEAIPFIERSEHENKEALLMKLKK